MKKQTTNIKKDLGADKLAARMDIDKALKILRGKKYSKLSSEEFAIAVLVVLKFLGFVNSKDEFN